jgi:outer membrane protein assembly factor BamD
MMKFFTLFCLILVFWGTSCKSRYETIRSGSDLDLKYKTASYFFNKHDFTKALPLLENLSSSMKGSERAEDADYFYAYCEYFLKDFQIARNLFKTFSEQYPNSDRAEECRFMAAKCSYQESGPYSLDQDNTYKAIDAMQLFVNLYPHSDRLTESNSIIDALRNKLERKSFEDAKLYYTIGEYKPAIITLRNSIRDYPDSQYREESEFLILKSQYLYARNSIFIRQEERFNDVLVSYKSFHENFPDSEFSNEADKLREESVRGIKDVKEAMAQALKATN